MGIEQILLVPIEKSKTAESLRDPELLKLFGEHLNSNVDPSRLGEIIGTAIKTYPADYAELFRGHTDICPVTQEPYSTNVADGKHIYCGQCGDAIGAIQKI